MRPNILSVGQVNGYIKSLLEEDVLLSELFVEGEISNFKEHSAGHLYFTLKDRNGALNCVLFKNYRYQLKFMPENGMKVVAFGNVSLYEKAGTYQLYVAFLEPAGKGALYMAFEQLKAKLDAEGLFEQRHKKPLPIYPRCIAIVTSETGAAVRDIIHVCKRRDPQISLVVVPTIVQGAQAAKSIVDSIRRVDAWGKADLIIVGRGGGSAEDLWSFNEEAVARAVFNATTPIISAVGHETDFTIADFVADLRAATPSAAAEVATIDRQALLKQTTVLQQRLRYRMEKIIQSYQSRLRRCVESRMFIKPLASMTRARQSVVQLQQTMHKYMTAILQRKKLQLQHQESLLQSISPFRVLNRGYAIVEKDGVVVGSVQQVQTTDALAIQVKDGVIKANVLGILQKERDSLGEKKEKF